MRHQANAREITVDKQKLIDIITENRDKHVKDYEAAVIAYREEAKRQLDEQAEALANGKTDLTLNLISPKNEVEEYNKLITMFEWEVADQVVLSQGEFNEYVHDETPFASQAKFLNSSYAGGRGR